MRKWWTTVGAVALCAAAAPSAWAATTHHPRHSSLRGHESTDEDAKPAHGKAAARKLAAEEKACANAKGRAAKAKACKKAEADEATPKKPTAAEKKACARAKTKAAKARLCKQEDEATDEAPSKADRRHHTAKEEVAETVVGAGSLPDARGKVSELAPAPEKVGRGDTLHAIARRTGVPESELIELNHLKKPYHVRVGASLKLPRTRAYTVHSGDTLSGVAHRFGVDADVLAAFNSFGSGSPIRAGQKIELPPNAEDRAAKLKATPAKTVKPKRTPAPATPRAVTPPADEEQAPPTPAPAVRAPPPQPYTPPPATSYSPPPAQSGAYPGATALPPVRNAPAQTMPPSVAPAPKQAPILAQPSYAPPQPEHPTANPPQESSGFQMIPAPSSPPASTRPSYAPRPTPQRTPPPSQTYRPPVSGRSPIIQTNPAPTQSQVAAAGRGRFIWPVRGNVLSGFGLKANGQRNDGLNISVTPGEPVRAAAAGEVVYAGDQVPSFGNLVLIKHAGGWVTAYAHLGHIAVANRDQVTQGQQIGVAGQTGAVDQPQLHFEVRYAASPQDKALPVDPGLVLPER